MSIPTHKVYILLGGNIGDVPHTFQLAINLIEQKIGEIKRSSHLYQSEAWGFESSNLFLNQVLYVETICNPELFLEKTQQIEKDLGRTKTPGFKGYESRMVDIDILFFDDLIYSSKTLTIPHPSLHKRKFTMAPLQEIAPRLPHPILKKDINKLYKECDDQSVVTLKVIP